MEKMKANASVPASCRYLTKHSLPASAINALLLRCVRGGKERMRRLMELVRHGRVDLTPLLTHNFPLDNIAEAYQLFGERSDGVLKIAMRP